MTESGDIFDELVSHARDAHVCVIGGGIAGLVAAYEFAKVGIAVTLLEMQPQLGGAIRSGELDGIRVDVGASSWRGDSAAMRDLITELGLDEKVVAPAATATWITDPAHGWVAPLPPQTVLGIPANPWDESVRRIIGWSGTWRAYLDRLRPPLTIGVARNLGDLVRSRMGAKVLDRLVSPLTLGRFGLRADQVDVDVAAPGLNASLTRTGSLGGAVSDLLVDREAAGVVSLEGGMPQLVDALENRLRQLGARVRTGTIAYDVTPADAGGWQVRFREMAAEADALPDPAAEGDDPAEGVLEVGAVIFAAPRDTVETLTESAVGLRAAAHPIVRREIVTLLVQNAALDGAPRGAEIYAVPQAPGAHGASGVVHQTARWAWLAQAVGVGRHVLSVAFDSGTAHHPTAEREGADLERFAREQASALLDIPLAPGQIVAWRRDRFELDRPASARDHAAEADRDRSLLRAAAGLSAVGAWVAGSGLANVVTDAVAEADRVRSTLLWGDATGF